MSDDWEMDEEVTRQHSRELNEQIGREHSAELDKQRAASEYWPPEGTRVRVKTTPFRPNGSVHHIEGVIGSASGHPDRRWVHFGAGIKWPVGRHEIEVIDE